MENVLGRRMEKTTKEISSVCERRRARRELESE